MRFCFYVIVLALALLGCQPSETQPSAGEATPIAELRGHLPIRRDTNVIVISFDAMRQDALGVFGSPRRTSPRLDTFAEESIVFENAYTVAPVTPTSFAAAFTGLLPHRVFHAWNLVHSDTLAGRFSEAGYSTGAFLNNVQLTDERNFHVGFDNYTLHRSRPDEEVLASSLLWLTEHRAEKLFAWIHFISPHSPYDYREASIHLYDPDYQGEFERTTTGRFGTDDPAEIARLRSLYDGEVFYVDHLFGLLIDGIRELGLLDKTIVLVTSDHGEEFYEHGGFQHDRLTEEHVRVPLLLRHPDVLQSFRTPVLTSNVDFFPTLLSLAGIENDVQLDGRDLTRLEEGPDWIAGVSMTGGKSRGLSLRKGSYKLIRTCIPEASNALFDLASDPDELLDLSAEKPDQVRALHRELGVVMGGEPCAVVQAAVNNANPTVGLSDENIDALKALGYLGD